MRRGHLLVALALLGGCYTGARASRGINAAWRGRSIAELEARWGKPQRGDAAHPEWVITGEHVELPSVRADASLVVEPGEAHGSLDAAVTPGQRWTYEAAVVTATVDAAGRIAAIEGPSVRWGAPPGANLRYGFLMGFHAGMGRLDDTDTWLPGGGLYLGGMLGPRLGLVGQFTLASGKGDAGGAMGLAASVGPQWWPLARLWLRAAPALVIDWDPGFDNGALRPGLGMAASYAVVRSGSFVLDLRLDTVATPAGAFGTVGVGVNVN